MYNPKLKKKTLIIEGLMQNLSVTEISKQVGCQMAYVSKVAKDVGIKPTRKKRNPNSTRVYPKVDRTGLIIVCAGCSAELQTWKRTPNAAWDVAIDKGWDWRNVYDFNEGGSDLKWMCAECK